MRSDRYADEQLNTENAAVKVSEAADEYLDEPADYTAETEAQATTPEELAQVEEPKKRFGRKAGKKANSGDKAANEVDLAKMKKKDLFEIMLAQGKEIDELRAKVEDLEAQLANREFEFERIGSIAEASLAVTNIFKDAEEAARIYLENIRRSYEKRSKEQSSK